MKVFTKDLMGAAPCLQVQLNQNVLGGEVGQRTDKMKWWVRLRVCHLEEPVILTGIFKKRFSWARAERGKESRTSQAMGILKKD